jgi:DNA-directed RNA polymerase subunit RPC12/RpoP
MAWCNDKDNNNSDVTDNIKLNEEIDQNQTIECPSCGNNIEVKNQVLISGFICFTYLV